MLDGAEHRRHLFDLAHEARERSAHGRFVRQRARVAAQHLALGVEGVGLEAEADRAGVALGAAFEEGQTADISLSEWTVHNRDTGAVLRAKPVPERLLALMTGGGIFPLLEAEGLIAPPAAG